MEGALSVERTFLPSSLRELNSGRRTSVPSFAAFGDGRGGGLWVCNSEQGPQWGTPRSGPRIEWSMVRGAKRLSVPAHKGIYKDRRMWRAGRSGPRFASYQQALEHLQSCTMAPAIARAARVPRVAGVGWAKTIYRGVLVRGARFRAQMFGQRAGYAASLHDAGLLLVAKFADRGVTLRFLLLRGPSRAGRLRKPSPPARKTSPLTVAFSKHLVRGQTLTAHSFRPWPRLAPDFPDHQV